MRTCRRRNGCTPNTVFLSATALLLCIAGDATGNSINSINPPLTRMIRSPVLVQSHTNRLIDEPACPEIRSLCKQIPNDKADDLTVLECVQSLQGDQVDGLTTECHAVVWQHVTDLMDDKNVRKLSSVVCAEDLEKLDCRSTGEPGQLLACLLDHRGQLSTSECHRLVEHLESVAFSDYRLIGAFIRDCNQDITQLECGRITVHRDELSQGKTLSCLQEHIDKLHPKCRKGVLHLSELQSDNIRYDRQLFLACIADSERLCPEARPGSGAVFKCLMRNRNEALLDAKCQDQLSRRYRLMSHDYKISHGLARACKEEIKEYKCRRGVADDKEVRLAQILLCLEGVQKNNSKIGAECSVEMADHRRLLMEDFQLSPEILSGCHVEMERFCNDQPTSAKTLHCLMEHARPAGKVENRVKPECMRALEALVKTADAGEDWRVDPVLRRACKPVVDVACRDTEGGDARVMNCLMDHLGTNYMTRDCESALMQIQYFVARDFKLDPQLYRKCKEDAVRLCHAKRSWTEVEAADQMQMDPERGPQILPCLHRNALHGTGDTRLRPECVEEVRRVMRQRAVSVDLIPELEEACLDDLAGFCFDKTEKGQEMQCLQDNLERLTAACRTAVASYTEDEAGHVVELNPVLRTVCKGAMEKYCGEIVRDGKDEGEMMECLIAHKNDADLRADAKCRAAIEHFQIISLKDFHFTYKFKEACRPYVTRYCPNSTTKYDVVSCLSEVLRDNIVNGERHALPKECRQQVRSQLYQQRENIDFDPHLKRECSSEIHEFCNDAPHGSGQVLECLLQNSGKLKTLCRRAIFSVKKSELLDSATDFTLMSACKPMVKQFCPTVDDKAVLDCLKAHKDDQMFDKQCHLIVVNRLIIQNQDYRFNPKLQAACSKNIADFCTDIVAEERQYDELNGKVLNCLKARFREGKLTKQCRKEVTEILQEQALNYKLNPLLQDLCKKEIQVLCKQSGESDEDHGEVEECLKQAFLSQQIITKECKVEVATLIQEAKADIHVDPLLQRACTIDLLKYCSEVTSGDGRQLKCLQVILNKGKSKPMEEDCRTMLTQRMEMFKNAAPLVAVPENLSELYSQVISSPSKRYFMILSLSFVAIVFVFGMVCGRVGRRTMELKNK